MVLQNALAIQKVVVHTLAPRNKYLLYTYLLFFSVYLNYERHNLPSQYEMRVGKGGTLHTRMTNDC